MQHLGEIIKTYRDIRNITIEDLSIKSNIGIDEILELENTGIVKDEMVLKKISEILEVDLVYQNNIYNDFISIQNEQYYLELRDAIYLKDYNKIKECINKFDYLPISENKEIKQTRLYGEILLVNIFEEDYQKSIDMALDGLGFNDIQELIDFIDEERVVKYAHSLYSINLSLGYSLLKVGQVQHTKYLYYKMFKHFNNYVVHSKEISEYDKRLFVILISNAGYLLFKTGEYDECLKNCEMGLEKSFKYNKAHMLDYLYKIKAECLYKIGEFEESKRNYLIFKDVVKYSNNTKLLNELNEIIKDEYTLLLES